MDAIDILDTFSFFEIDKKFEEETLSTFSNNQPEFSGRGVNIEITKKERGYDLSDGITGNKEGGFNYKSNKRQWLNNIDQDPKKIFSTTQKAIAFIEKQAKSNTPFFLQVSHNSRTII